MKGAHPAEDHLIAFALDELGELAELDKLDDAERYAVATHITSCEACQGMVTSLTAALENVRSTARPSAPAHVLVNLLTAQADQTAIHTRRMRSVGRRGLRPAIATAGLVVVLFAAGFWTGRQTARLSPPDTPIVEESMPVPSHFPDPPMIPFQTAMVADSV